MSTFRLRPACYRDIPRIARVFSETFQDDVLLGDRMHPHRLEHPDGMELWFLRGARVSFWDYTTTWLVVVQELDGEDVVVGCAHWCRLGRGGQAKGLWWFDPRNLLKPLSSAAMTLHARLWPNRACDPEQLDVIERCLPFVSHLWSGERAECWNLEALGVHPTYQGRGLGKLLARWGLGQASREGVCASVTVAPGKDGFYQACGFDLQDGNCGAGVGNPLAGGDGGNIWWRLPASAVSL